MNLQSFGIIRLYICSAVLLSFTKVFEVCSATVYTNTYAVHVEGGKEKADAVAAMHGFINVGEIIDNHFHFIDHRQRRKRFVQPSLDRHHHLRSHPHVKSFQQQTLKSRKKRGNLPGIEPQNSNLPQFIDPDWGVTWYLNRGDHRDMNVIPAWERGYTGRGVVVSILDDGLEKDHPDLKTNYDHEASYDVNSHDNDPQPRYDFTNENRHGTRCAGEVAAEANNNVCTVGVAFHASIGGVRMLDGDVTDAVEARSLSHNPNHVDIYSASWGPDDDGKTVDGPGQLARQAFIDGATKGRNGLGSIFVWASGNGGRMQDSCNCDGYTNTIYTLSVSSVSENGNIPWYSEKCASTLATTYSSGGGGEKQVVTVDLRKKCTKTHSGTSASAPLAAAICALALEANPTLTWRDLQHIVVNTAKSDNLKATDWITNGAGYKVSHAYGFGLMDAAAMVDLALRWPTAPPMKTCSQSAIAQRKQIRGKLSLDFTSNGCDGTSEKVIYLEKVHAVLSINFPRRGDLVIHLTSPMGTRSMLLPKRPHDASASGFSSWEFMSTHTWGEQPAGVWNLEIENKGSSSHSGYLTSWILKLYGTETNPMDFQTSTREPTTEKKTTRKPEPTTRETFTESATTEKLTTKEPTTQWTTNAVPSTKEPLATSTKKMTSPNLVTTPRSNIITSNLTSKTTTSGKESATKEPVQPIIPECPQGSYRGREGHCSPCHPTCGQCVTSGDTMCVICSDGTVPFGITVYDGQPVGKCFKCNSACSRCNGPDHKPCTECDQGWHLTLSGQCSACHPSCKRCVAEGSKGCTETKEVPECGQVTLDEVVTGTYFDESIWECRACAKGCLDCHHQGSCAENPQPPTLCSEGFYLEIATTTCRACHSDCISCSGPNEFQCLEMRSTTADNCPDGTYLDRGLGICQHCHQRCFTCHGGEETDCLQERPTTKPCPEGQYRATVKEHWETEFKDTCLPCHEECILCMAAGVNGCTSRHGDPNQCPNGFYLKGSEFDTSCDQCHESCLTCHGGKASDCINCHDDYSKRDTYCVVVYLPLLSRTYVKIISAISILIVICIILSFGLFIKIRKNSTTYSDVKYQKLGENDILHQKVFEDANYSM